MACGVENNLSTVVPREMWLEAVEISNLLLTPSPLGGSQDAPLPVDPALSLEEEGFFHPWEGTDGQGSALSPPLGPPSR